MRKIISFSLWGDSKIYNYGAVENAIIAKEIYPEWECWFYLGKGVLKNVKEYLSKMSNVKIIDKSDEQNKLSNMLWRFEPGFTTDDIIISRDCDSRLNIREKLAVDEWLSSNKDFHIMRDHPYGHRGRVLGGMWGSRNGILKEFLNIYETFCKNKNNKYLYDMDLFNKVIYWRLGGKIYVHATYFKYEKEAKDFPKCIYDAYVGEIIEDCSIASSIFGDNENFFKQLRCME